MLRTRGEIVILVRERLVVLAGASYGFADAE